MNHWPDYRYPLKLLSKHCSLVGISTYIKNHQSMLLRMVTDGHYGG